MFNYLTAVNCSNIVRCKITSEISIKFINVPTEKVGKLVIAKLITALYSLVYSC